MKTKPFINKTCKLCYVLMLLVGLSVVLSTSIQAVSLFSDLNFTLNKPVPNQYIIPIGVPESLNYQNYTFDSIIASGNYWYGNAGDTVILNLTQVENLSKMHVISTPGSEVVFPKSFIVSVSNDNSAYTEVINYNTSDCGSPQNAYVNLMGYSGQYIKLVAQQRCDLANPNFAIGEINISRLAEPDEYLIDNCTIYNTTSINFNFFDIITKTTPVYINYSLSVDYGVTSLDRFYSKEANNKSRISLCINPDYANLTSNINILYFVGPAYYTYYSANTTLSQNLNNITIYVSSSATEVSATVYDNTNTEVEGAYIYVQKYDTTSGNYLLAGVYKTNFEGKVNMFLDLNTVYYKFLIYYPLTNLRKTTTPSYIYSNSINFQIITGEEVLDNYFKSQGVTSSLTFNNATNNFNFVYTDTSASISQACLTLYKDFNLLNTSCSTSASGTLLLNIVPVNGSSYTAQSSVFYSNSEYPLQSISVYFSGANTLGMMGLVIALILTIAFAFLLTFSIPLGIIMLPVPIVFLSAIHLIPVGIEYALSLQLAALILAIIINQRG